MSKVKDIREKYKERSENFNLPIFSRVCMMCIHFQNFGSARKCSAFPGGIPNEIWKGENNHTAPYKDDNGIRFESIKLPRAA